jgi:glycine/sarcosine N-methyltransferase
VSVLLAPARLQRGLGGNEGLVSSDSSPRASGETAGAAGVSSVLEFYDSLAEDYHLVYGDSWDEAVAHQGATLDALIGELRPGATEVLDCSCGIGTQAIGLALRDYRVLGTDISERSITRARDEAARLNADAHFEVADFRNLDTVAGDFDVVLSCDNAIPHLLDGAEVHRALRAMHAKLRVGGLLVVGIRDYDTALIERPVTAAPLLIAGPPRRLFVRLHDWDAPDSPFYTVRFFVLTDTGSDWTLTQHSTRYRAIRADALGRVARGVGFKDVAWHSAENTGHHQPLMTAARAST